MKKLTVSREGWMKKVQLMELLVTCLSIEGATAAIKKVREEYPKLVEKGHTIWYSPLFIEHVRSVYLSKEWCTDYKLGKDFRAKVEEIRNAIRKYGVGTDATIKKEEPAWLIHFSLYDDLKYHLVPDAVHSSGKGKILRKGMLDEYD